jgi:hypothetical protein
VIGLRYVSTTSHQRVRTDFALAARHADMRGGGIVESGRQK